MTNLISARKRPCSSCPYRKDTPSGVWSRQEYEALIKYDGDTGEQLMSGAIGVFHCHTSPDHLCSGWLGCHDPNELAALRMFGHLMDPSVWTYTTDVPLHASGQAAHDHGVRDIRHPSKAAKDVVSKLIRIREDVCFEADDDTEEP